MVRSMTGYGRAQALCSGMHITVELKSVNHRYFEFSARTPRAYGFLEEKLKNHIQAFVSRGKVECGVLIDSLEAQDVEVQVNHALASGYIDALRQLQERYGLRDDLCVSTVSRYNDIFSVRKKEVDEEAVWSAVRQVADNAVSAFVRMRELEGERLKADILSRAGVIIENVSFIEQRSPETVREYNEKLLARMQELLGDVHVEEQRLLTEAAIYADKIAVAEETVRLRSHMDQLHALLDAKEAVGRKLDFLVQEINREANTIGSKAQDVQIARCVLNMKAEVEKIREQVQNIE